MIIVGDSALKLLELETNSVDAVVTDPPYGLKFMGKEWDYDVPGVELWKEVLRVLKPGGHLLAFAGTRTYHRMAVNIEGAGLEIRDQIMWLYGQGFPKSLDISKALDKFAGVDRKISREGSRKVGLPGQMDTKDSSLRERRDDPDSEAAKQWAGWGTALKPANEPICMARKPISEKNIAENVLRWGVGGINVDASRIESKTVQSRFPANLLLDEDAAAALDAQSGTLTSGRRGPGYIRPPGNCYSPDLKRDDRQYSGDSGGASRFFYCAKVSTAERNAGLETMTERRGGTEQFDSRWKDGVGEERMPMKKNHHPTVKPIKLMEYLCRLVTPSGGVILDPFMGSGSTGVAAVNLKFQFIGIEREPEYAEIARLRISLAENSHELVELEIQPSLFSEAK